jgi:acyl phosphate:glycerol-3-phosphate acyltransferase
MMLPVDEMLRAIISLAIGLLLGSVLPADLLARAKGIDIRSIGDGNPGTVNAFLSLGAGLGLITAAYDISVGVIAVEIAKLIGVSEGFAYLAGVMSVVGHRFPVFGRFQGGGQGMAASAGLLAYGVALGLRTGWLSAIEIAILIAILLIAFAVTRSDKLMAIVMLPVLVAIVLYSPADWQFRAFMIAVAMHIWIVQAIVIRRSPSPRTIWWWSRG